MYVPVMKNRTVEVNVLNKLAEMHVFTENIIPLVEIIQERTRSNNKKAFLDELSELLNNHPEMMVMIDFYKSTKLRNTTDSIREYVTKATRYPEFVLDQLSLLNYCADQIIPIVSYLPEAINWERIENEIIEFRKRFARIGFRIKAQEFEKVYSFIESHVEASDYVILDIENASYSNPVFKRIYKRIADSKKEKGFTSIIVNAHRPDDLTNKAMGDGEPIERIDNGLSEQYSTSALKRFDGFGDYACITASLPSTGGTISPVGIYYSYENNFFVSFRGRADLLSEFPEYIAPEIMKSDYWEEFSEEHHVSCPGCAEIRAIRDKEISGRNQAQWKKITMLHYIYTQYELINGMM